MSSCISSSVGILHEPPQLEVSVFTYALIYLHHHIIVSKAEARIIGLYSYIRLHHRCTENNIKLVVLQLTVQRTYRTATVLVILCEVKRLVDGYCINLFQNFLQIHLRY